MNFGTREKFECGMMADVDHVRKNKGYDIKVNLIG